jgi:hypothetical protein
MAAGPKVTGLCYHRFGRRGYFISRIVLGRGLVDPENLIDFAHVEAGDADIEIQFTDVSGERLKL